jgi:hypothetical protein
LLRQLGKDKLVDHLDNESRAEIMIQPIVQRRR